MAKIAPLRMTVDEFHAWAEDQPRDYETIDGRPHAMSPERIRHLESKGETYLALKAAIVKAGAPCQAFTDGATVRIDRTTAFRPDAMVRCGKRLDGDEVDVVDPVIVVEVASPSTRRNDEGLKLVGYFGLSSLHHYLQVDPDKRVVIHHARDGASIRTHILWSGPLRLDPPGLDLRIEDLFGPEEAAP